jgi:tRNA G37 N-methylase TrmD
VPGVLGEWDSLEDERATTGESYTRPETIEWKGKKLRVPKVFVSGDHQAIEKRRTKK